MFQTFSYDDQTVSPVEARQHWLFMETNSAAAVMKAVCPVEWAEIVQILSTSRIDPKTWLKAGGNRGDIPEEIDALFGKRMARNPVGRSVSA